MGLHQPLHSLLCPSVSWCPCVLSALVFCLSPYFFQPSNLHQEQTSLLDIQFPACHALLFCVDCTSFSFSLFAVMNRRMDAWLDKQAVGWMAEWVDEKGSRLVLSACQPPRLCWTTRSGVLVFPGLDVSRSSANSRGDVSPHLQRNETSGRVPSGRIVMRSRGVLMALVLAAETPRGERRFRSRVYGVGFKNGKPDGWNFIKLNRLVNSS